MGNLLATRRREPEWMDDPGADPVTLEKSLRFIRRINRFLGYTRATLNHLKRFSRQWKPGETIHIVDLATGSADIPRAILSWGRRMGFDLRVVGVDRHDTTAAAATSAGEPDEHLQIIRADVLAMPLADRSFDYALTNMFLHHLDDADVVQVLKTMDRITRRGIIAADLLRHRRALWWIRALSAGSNPLVRHDAVVSVMQAFTKADVLELRQQAGLAYAQYFRHFGHRFVLAGEKE